jgi:hypothetical protein
MAWQSLALAQTCLFLAAFAEPQDLSQVHFFLLNSRIFTLYYTVHVLELIFNLLHEL